MKHPLLQALGARAAAWPLALLLALGLLAWCGPWLSPHDPAQPLWGSAWLSPQWQDAHWFGTDAIGRDLYVRVLEGLRSSLLIGVLAGACALALGSLIGALGGFLGGWVDGLLLRANDVLTSLPLLLVVILILTWFEPSLWLLLLTIGAFGSLDVARVLRIEALRLRETEFMLAARAMGMSRLRAVLRHGLPNLAPMMLSALSMAVPQAILVESFLAFLGLGPSATGSSLGTLLAEGAQDLQQAPWLLLIPALTLALLLIGFGLWAEQLRRALAQHTGSAGHA